MSSTSEAVSQADHGSVARASPSSFALPAPCTGGQLTDALRRLGRLFWLLSVRRPGSTAAPTPHNGIYRAAGDATMALAHRVAELDPGDSMVSVYGAAERDTELMRLFFFRVTPTDVKQITEGEATLRAEPDPVELITVVLSGDPASPDDAGGVLVDLAGVSRLLSQARDQDTEVVLRRVHLFAVSHETGDSFIGVLDADQRRRARRHDSRVRLTRAEEASYRRVAGRSLIAWTGS